MQKIGWQAYTSICNKDKRKGKNTSSSVLCTEVSKALVYPVAIVIVNCIKCRALLDISSSSVYVSLALINQIKIALKRMKQKSIEILIGSSGSLHVILDCPDGDQKFVYEEFKEQRYSALFMWMITA